MAVSTVTGPHVDAVEDPAAAGLFVVVMGHDTSSVHRLPSPGQLLVGRAEDAEIRLIEPVASRHHLRIITSEGESAIEVEDLESTNGSYLRDERLPARTRRPFTPGEALIIGSTILVIQRRTPREWPSRIFPHGYFETRLTEACARAERLRASFALVRLQIRPREELARAEPLLARLFRPGDVVGCYGPAEYEVLLLDSSREDAERMLSERTAELASAGLEVSAGLSMFPEDGVMSQVLVARACGRLRERLAQGMGGRVDGPAGVVLIDPAMRALYTLAERAAGGQISVLILGETGVGKEVLAETVHRRSARAGRPFVSINCGALSESLLESELFGHEKGAFTGAVKVKVGLLEAAEGGTVFLDEVGEMSLALQAALLRALETRCVLRVGATTPRKIDVRFVAATNRDLEEEVAARRFRQDLYFRLNGITLQIPPLRERPDEIEPLATMFLESTARASGCSTPQLQAEAVSLLRSYPWPGNVRELRNVMERALLLCEGAIVSTEHLPLERMLRAIEHTNETDAQLCPEAAPPAACGSLHAQRHAFERSAIIDALARCAGNQSRAAELLGMPRRTFCARLRQYGIPRPRS